MPHLNNSNLLVNDANVTRDHVDRGRFSLVIRDCCAALDKSATSPQLADARPTKGGKHGTIIANLHQRAKSMRHRKTQSLGSQHAMFVRRKDWRNFVYSHSANCCRRNVRRRSTIPTGTICSTTRSS